MDEKKISGKQVSLGADKKTGNVEGKLSYEDLNKACADLSQQNQQMQAYIQNMHKQMQQMNVANQFKRLDYLFRVVEIASNNKPDSEYPCFAAKFVESCIAEIQESMTIPEETKEKEN